MLHPRRFQAPRDLTGATRWILVRDDGSHRRVTYPSAETAERFAAPGEYPVRVRITGRGGPFSDTIERVD